MPDTPAAELVSALLREGRTIATGESLTAGMVASTIASIPGCSAVFRGGIVAYHADVKAELLRVPEDALSAGIVSEAVSVAMARGAAEALHADIGVGTTGVAGPDPHDGQPAGTVWVAAWSRERHLVRRLDLGGDRGQIRRQSVEACLQLAGELLVRDV